MIESFNDIKPIMVIEARVTPISISNMGISAVVPAFKLHEILLGEEMINLRR